MGNKKTYKIHLPKFDGGWWFYDSGSEDDRYSAFFIPILILGALVTLAFVLWVMYLSIFTNHDALVLKDIFDKTILIGVLLSALLSTSLWVINTMRWIFYFAKGYEMVSRRNIVSLDSHPFFSLLSALIFGILLIIAIVFGCVVSLVCMAIITAIFGNSIGSSIFGVFCLVMVVALYLRKRNIQKYEVYSRLSEE